MLSGGKGFQKKSPEWKPPVKSNHSNPPDASEAVHEQEFPGGADLKLEADPEDYSDNSDNTPSSL